MPDYEEDLAYIHQEGFGGYALGSAPGLLKLLRDNGVLSGLMVDLGCGNGVWPKALVDAGYEVLGVDASPSMIRLAKKTAPRAQFRTDSIVETALPRCAAVTSIGEVLSYAFAADADFKGLRRFLRRVYRALNRGGIFLFDVGSPGQLPAGMPRQGCWTGPDWAVIAESEEDPDTAILSRRITSFRQRNQCYRRTEEIHWLRLYRPADIEAELAQAGFHAKRLRGFGTERFRSGHAGFLARKPF
jgi:SAM-dependent methyltransferase